MKSGGLTWPSWAPGNYTKSLLWRIRLFPQAANVFIQRHKDSHRFLVPTVKRSRKIGSVTHLGQALRGFQATSPAIARVARAFCFVYTLLNLEFSDLHIKFSELSLDKT